MKTKVFYGNQHKYINLDSKWNQAKSMTKKCIKVSAIICLMGWGAVAISYYFPRQVYADRHVIVEVKSDAPIMKEIARCESGGNHFDKTGQVVMRGNLNKTVDVGKYQINSVWYKKASELGLNITKEEDNEKMAYWIYENRGTEDWYASKSCWSK